MNLRTRFRFVSGPALLLLIVVAASVAARPPLPGALELPLRITGAGERAALAPLAAPYWQWHHPALAVPPTLALPAPGIAQLLPNWEVGRNAVVLIPNYEPGTVTFELTDIGVISDSAPTPIARHAAPIYTDKP